MWTLCVVDRDYSDKTHNPDMLDLTTLDNRFSFWARNAEVEEQSTHSEGPANPRWR